MAQDNKKTLVNYSYDGGTVLHRAAAKGDNASVMKYLDRGAPVDIEDEFGWTPFHVALIWGQFDTAKLLLQRGADKHAWTRDGIGTMLHEAVGRYPSIKHINFLLEQGLDVNRPGYKGETALHTACEFDNVEVVELLLEAKAHTDITSEDKITPLHVACRYRNKKVVEKLLQAGARTDIQDEFGNTPFEEVREYEEIRACFSKSERDKKADKSSVQESAIQASATESAQSTPIHVLAQSLSAVLSNPTAVDGAPSDSQILTEDELQKSNLQNQG